MVLFVVAVLDWKKRLPQTFQEILEHAWQNSIFWSEPCEQKLDISDKYFKSAKWFVWNLNFKRALSSCDWNELKDLISIYLFPRQFNLQKKSIGKR